MEKSNKRTKRIGSFLLAIVMVLSLAVPSFAIDDLSGWTPSEIWDVSGGSGDGFIVDDNAPWDDIGSSDTSSDEEDPPDSSTADNSWPAESDHEDIPEDEPEESGTEAALFSSEDTETETSAEPPQGFSFSAAMEGVAYRATSSGSTTIYMSKIPGIQHRYPFNGGNQMMSGYLFTTSDGKPAYCIEPARFNSVNGDVVTGSESFGSLSSAKQAKIARAIASNPYGASNTSAYFACQAIIWQIVYGESFGSGSVYNAIIAANSSLSSPYQEIISKMEAGGEIPSFMSADKNSPTIHEMTDDGSGTWSVDLQNSNSKVTLKGSDFKSRGPLQFNVSGNTLTVKSSSAADSDSFVEWHSNEGGGSGLVFWSGGRQAKCTLVGDSVPGDGYMAFSTEALPPPEEDLPEPPAPEEPGLGYLTIYKYDGRTNLPLAGAIFKIECDGFINDAFEVPYGGKTAVIPIPPGQESVDVTVTEVRAPDKYVMDSTPKTVTVHKDDTINIAEVSFANMPADCSLTIVKHETGNSGVKLAGARFRIRYSNPDHTAQNWTETTDANGEIHIKLPEPGTLIIEELEAPAGYVIGNITTHDVTVQRGEDKVINISNDKKAQLIVTKKDAQTGQYLAGAVIQATLLRSHTEPHEAGMVYTQTTGEEGKTVFNNLIPGEYRVEEIQPPQYYKPTTQVHTVSIFEGNTETVSVEFRNDPWTGLTIKKVDATNDQGLKGAIFKLYKGSAEDSKAYMGDWETNENGVVTISKLDPGYYTIVESQAPYGYLLDEEHHIQTIEIKPDAVEQHMTVIFRNPPKPKILIEKIDEITGQKLAGAVFHISKKDSIEYEEVITGPDGTVLIENLDNEWYVVTEIRAPSGYVLDSTPHNVQAVPGKTVTLKINNLQQPDLLIRKIDEQTGEGLAGAVFRLTKDGAAEYQDVTTGPDGTILVKDLDPGWYIVVEQQAPAGYLLDQTPHYIEVTAGHNSELIVKDKHKPSLKIVKLDNTTKQPLAYARFRVSIKNGKELGVFTTNANGEIFFDNIDPELYVIEEIQPPPGYNKLDATKEILVEWGQNVVVEFYNQPINPLLIKKVDVKTGEPLEKARFLVTHVNGEFVGEYETGRNGFITVTGIPAGWYTVKEIEAPLGYILDDTPKQVQLTLDKPAIVEFEDEPLNGLHIKKIDSLTKEPLQGAAFRVSEKGGRLIGEFTSDAQGEIVVDGLQPGWYTIEELRAPDGYVIDETPKDVEFVWGQFVNVEFLNSRKAPLQVKKIDGDTGEPLEGATFHVESVEGKNIGDFTTDRYGCFTVNELPAGWYIVTETQPAPGYLLDNTPRTIEVKTNQPVYLEFTNHKLSPLQIKKIDEDTGAPLAGALFRVTTTTGDLVGEFSTGKDGFINVPELSPGSYIVSELKSPEGYQLDATPKTVVVKENQTTLVEFTNKALPGLQVRKVDKVTGEPLAGVKFRVAHMDGEVVGTYTTNSAGYFVVSGLPSGWYTVYETQAPSGYELDETPQNVELKPNKTAELEFQDQPLVGLRILKVDKDTNMPLEGATFEIIDAGGTSLGSFTTDVSGIIFAAGLKEGWHTVIETAAPDGYLLDNSPQKVFVKSGEATVLKVANKRLSQIQIKKIDEETNEPIAGVQFRITKATGAIVGEFTTDRGGLIQVPELEPGAYVITEIKAADGYLLDNASKTVQIKKDTTLLLEFTNRRLPGLQVKKLDKVSGEPLAGAKFKVEKANGERIGEFTTNAAGFFVVSDLEPGWYSVFESKAPAGYQLDSEPQNVELKHDKTAVVEFEDVPLSGLQIRKTDAVTGKPMSGVEFKITRMDQSLIGNYTTDESGIAFIEGLQEGWYIVTETKTLEGYRIDSAPRNVEIRADRLNVIEYKNQPYPHLIIKKIDSDTKQPLAGVTFSVFDKNGRELGKFKTNNLGQIHLTGMEAGKYTIQEVEAKEGYVLDSTVRELTLLWGKTTTLEIPNLPLSTLRIKKIDALTKKPLMNATFVLRDMKNNIIGEYTTNDSGIIEFPREIKAGKYKLQETKAPDGYVLDNTVKSIEVKQGQTLELEIPNQPVRGKIQIVKKAADDSSITKKKKGALLEGAVFEIYNTKLEVVDRITTDSRGVANSVDLPVGIYAVKEIAAPKYYYTDGETFYAEIKNHDDLIRFEVTNKSEDISVSIEKRGNVQAMPGDIIQYDFSNIANTSNISLDDFFWHDLLPTDAVRINELHTGTWSEKLTYKVTYRTNLKQAYRVLADKLSTTTDNVLQCGREALGLAANEFVTDIKFEFGTVGAGFHSVEGQVMTVTVLGDLPDGYRFTNRTDVGGRTGDEWSYAKDAWTTCIFAPPRGVLPKTGM